MVRFSASTTLSTPSLLTSCSTLASRCPSLPTSKGLRGGLRDALARQARFPLGDRIVRLRRNAERALTRELAPGTRLVGALSVVQPQGAFVTEQGVTLRVFAEGTARVTQDVGTLGLTAR